MATGYGAKFQTQVTALAWSQIQAEPFGRGSFICLLQTSPTYFMVYGL